MSWSTTPHAKRSDRDNRSEIEAELEAHLELFVEDRVRAGADPEIARAEAERQFGDRHRITLACLIEDAGENSMKKTYFLAIVTLLLVGAGLLMTLAQARRAQTLQASAVMAEHQNLLGVPILKGIQPVAPEELRAYVGGRLKLVARSGSPQTPAGSYQVQRDGHILLPGIGWFEVAGKSRPLLERELNEVLQSYYQDLVLDVVIEDLTLAGGALLATPSPN